MTTTVPFPHTRIAVSPRDLSPGDYALIAGQWREILSVTGSTDRSPKLHRRRRPAGQTYVAVRSRSADARPGEWDYRMLPADKLIPAYLSQPVPEKPAHLAS